jgi:hypothetical protein
MTKSARQRARAATTDEPVDVVDGDDLLKASIHVAQPIAKATSKPKAEVVDDGDWAGYTYDEVIELTSAAIDDVYAPLSIQGVCAVHDMKLAEILEIARHFEGERFAHEAALRFGQTIMPYLASYKPKNAEHAWKSVTAELAKLKGEKS